MSIEEHYPNQYADLAHLAGTDLVGDLVNQRIIYDTLAAQAGPANPPNDTDARGNVDGVSTGADHTYNTQSVDPTHILQGTNIARGAGLAGATQEDIAAILRRELRTYYAAPVRLEVPTVIATVRMYLAAPVSGVSAAPVQLLSVDTNRYRVLIDAYSETGAGTFRLFLGQTSSDAVPGAGFRFDNSQSHPIQIYWGSDMWVSADPANTVGGYVNLIVERFK